MNPEDDLDLDLDDDTALDDHTSLDDLYPTGDVTPIIPIVLEKPGLDTDALGGLITGALGVQSKQTSDLIEGLASKFLAQSAATVPKAGKTPEQIAESNMRISTLLATGGAGLDLEEELGKLVAPRIQAAIQAEIERFTPHVANLHASGGEEIVESFKRKLGTGKSEKLSERLQEEVDKLIKPENYQWLAGLSPKERKETLQGVQERALGRVYSASLGEKGSRGATTGSSSAGTNTADSALHALPKSQQNEIRKFAEALTRQHGHAVGSPAYNKSVQRYVKEYLEDNT